MKHDDAVAVEIMPSSRDSVRSGSDELTLNRLVQEKVAEIMADRDAMIYEPFFRSRQIAYELKRLQAVPEQRKWSVYFERYGCLICETRERIHSGNGMCRTCQVRTTQKLQQIIREGMTGKTATPSRQVIVPGEKAPHLLPAKVHRRWNKPRSRKSGAK